MNRLFVDNLTVIDFAYLDPERGLVGESWILDIELAGELNEDGMVFDFGHVKKNIKEQIDTLVDHRLLVPEAYPGLQWLDNDRVGRLLWETSTGWHIEHSAPESAVIAVPGERLDRHRIESLLVSELQPGLPSNIREIRVRLSPEATDGAFYHYTHGLRKHDGNCQRIAHGHRSRLNIWRNGERAPDLEQYWACRWEDIHLANRCDESALFIKDGIEYRQYHYAAGQGAFELTLPASRVETLAHDTTVEWIACYLKEETEKLEPQASIVVKAFEGVNKGACAGD